MSDASSKHDNETDRSVIDLIREIQSGSRTPKSLAVEDRRHCVQHLGAEGLTLPEIAQILGCSDRTIARDRKALQDQSALRYDPEQAARIVGHYFNEAHNTRSRLLRIARDKGTSVADRIESERVAFDVYSKMFDRLQRFGILPQAPTQIQADITHSSAEPPTFDEISEQLRGLIEIRELAGEPTDELRALLDRTARERLASDIVIETTHALPASPGKEEIHET